LEFSTKKLLRFFVEFVLFAPFAKLFELETLFVGFFIFTRIIIHVFALGALEFDKIILGHKISFLQPEADPPLAEAY